MVIQGCDLSHWNSDAQFKNLLASDLSFFMLKATEGKAYVDKKMAARAKEITAAGAGFGLYHYARPENNAADVEATNFIKAAREFGDNCVYALDWEGEAERCDPEWIVKWCSKVEQELGRTPMLYVNHAYAVKAVAKLANYPLWCAKWGSEPTGTIGPWSEYTVWQWTNSPYDKDLFKGSVANFAMIGKPEVEQEEFGHYCGCCCCCSRK